MARKIQNEDVKGVADVTSPSSLINDDKIYVTASSLNKTLKQAVIDGDLSGGGGGALDVASYTANQTLTGSNDVVLVDGTSGGFTITLPAAASNSGKVYKITRTDNTYANIIVVDANASETIGGATTRNMIFQNETWDIVSDGTNWQIISHFSRTPMQSFGTNTITATTTNPTKGTITTDRIIGYRDGSVFHGQIEYGQSVAGGAGSGDYLWAVPFSMDTSFVTFETTVEGASSNWDAPMHIGDVILSNESQSQNAGHGAVIPYDATHIRFFTIDPTSFGAQGSSWFPLSLADGLVSARFSFQVNGWDA